MSGAQAVLFTATLLVILGIWALVRHAQKTRDSFDMLIADDHTPPSVSDTPPPAVVLLPDGFTCLRCMENPALPDRIWCTVCAPIIDALPAEPCDHGGIQGSIARHPAGKQRKTGGDQ